MYINQDHLGLMLVLIYLRLLICIIVDIIVLICSFIKQIVSQSEVKSSSYLREYHLPYDQQCPYLHLSVIGIF